MQMGRREQEVIREGKLWEDKGEVKTLLNDPHEMKKLYNKR
jgi:hypothetical protein